MSTSTFVVSYTHTVTYVTTKMLLILKEIVREIGLDPAKFANSWESCERAMPASSSTTCMTAPIALMPSQR